MKGKIWAKWELESLICLWFYMQSNIDGIALTANIKPDRAFNPPNTHTQKNAELI